MQPPKSLSRDLLLRGITYKIQERAFGGLSKSILRKLTGTEPEASSAENRRAAPRTTVKPGTRLVREWNGDTHTVLVHADGVEWRGSATGRSRSSPAKSPARTGPDRGSSA